MLRRAVAEWLPEKETTQMPDDQREIAAEQVRQQEEQLEAAERARIEAEELVPVEEVVVATLVTPTEPAP